MAKKQTEPSTLAVQDAAREDINTVSVAAYAQQAYLDYAMSVVCGRAIPYLEDGQKPVQRRTLYTMNEMRLAPEGKPVKSAKIIGTVLGSYHPHGDQSVYDAMVRQTQNFVMRYPLVHGEGNFGSRDGDGAAAMRYCFTGTTRILTELGLVQISDIPKILALPHDGEQLETSFSVSSIGGIQKASKWLYSGIQDVSSVKTRYGHEVSCTANEPFLVLNEDLDYQWKLVNELNPGDTVAIQTNAFVSVNCGSPLPIQKTGFPANMSTELATFLGLILSDGSLRMAGTSVQFGSSDNQLINQYCKLVSHLFPKLEPKVTTIPAGRISSCGIVSKLDHQLVTINSTQLVNFLKTLDCHPCYAAEKKVPEVIFRSSASEVAAFLSAYYEGDGGISTHPRNINLTVTSTSKEMLKGIKSLLLSHFGIVSQSITLGKKADKKTSSDPSYRLIVVATQHIQTFLEKVGFLTDKKKEKARFVRPLLGGSTSFFRNEIPHLGSFISKKLVELNSHSLIDEFGQPFKKQMFFKNGARVNRFKKIKTEFKLRHWLSMWSQESKQAFPSLWGKLNGALQNGFFYDQIKSITHEGKQPVYDLTVENTHAFIANGFVAHNTEAKLSTHSKHLLRDLNSGTVDFRPNYDGTTEEPDILPARLPFILMNGAEGVGVGMACSIPPHRAAEVTQGAITLLKNPQATFEDVMAHIPGPDFPTGGQLIQSREKILAAYKDGNGTLKLRGRWDVETGARGAWKLIVKELPYGTSPQKLMEQVDALLNPKPKEKGNKKEFTPDQLRLKQLFGGLIDLYRDESGKEQAVRVVFEPKTFKQNPQDLIDALLAYTSLQDTIKINFVMVGRDRRPSCKGILSVLTEWNEFRVEVTRRRLEHEKAAAERRLHIVEGRLKIMDAIQEAIKVIQSSDDPKAALMARFDLSEIQANDVLEMRLRQLARLEGSALTKEKAELEKTIAKLKRLLAKANELVALVIEELEADLKSLGEDPRLTLVEEIADADEPASSKSKAVSRVPEEAVTVALSDKFWVRAKTGLDQPADGFVFKTGDSVARLFNSTTHQTLFAMDHTGRVYSMDVSDVPSGRGGEGLPLASVWELQGKLNQAWTGQESEKYLLVSSQAQGFVTKGSDLQTRMKAGKVALVVDSNAQPLFPVNVTQATPESQVVCLSSDGSVVAFPLGDLPVMGKGKGVGFMGLRDKCTLVDVVVTQDRTFGVQENGKTRWVSGEEFDSIFGSRAAGKRGRKFTKTDQALLVIKPVVSVTP